MIIYGPLTISGSTNLSGSLYSKNLMYATASWALNTKTASYVSASNIIVNNLTVVGTLNADIITGSLFFGTASYSTKSISSSYAITSSYSKVSNMAATASYALNSGCDCNLAIAYAIALG